ncbi:MAG: adenylate/guanylate cyclase domain-containing protein [Chloroflexi bacterium]|nr:adenylate/guanylate cyclase domain-containing protein [Chloroflexota bacterium]
MEPQIQYAKTSDGVSIAYATEGEGPPLVLLLAPGVAHVQRAWEMFPSVLPPLMRTFRITLYDPRGAGLSDRHAIDYSIEAMLRDLDAVVDRTGLQSFAVGAFRNAVPVAVTYAATFPDRVSHLILIDGWTNWFDIAGTPTYEALEALVDKDWTLFTETMARVLLGMDDPHLIKGLGEYIRACIEPNAYRAFMVAVQSWDVADLLPDVKAHTLVLHNNDARIFPIRAGQKLAAGIPDARFLAIDDMNYERVAALVEAFLTGREPSPATPKVAADMYTILFTDMASSTTLADQLGDAAAQEVRRAHNAIVRAALGEHAGREIKHTGDGIMASFATASSALNCAIAIQQGVAAHKEAHPESPLGVYVGLNAGEPIAEDDDLFGTSVDLAARICDRAEPGQILASDVVRQLAAGKDFLFADLGETELRGFEDPVKLWEVRWREEPS